MQNVLECQFTLKAVSPISFSKPVGEKKKADEGHDDFEERTWPQRLHVNADGNVILPPQNVKNCLVDCAMYLAETIPGKGKQTWTKKFKAGTMLTEPMLLKVKGKPVPVKSVESERLFVPSDGRSGGGSRVWKRFPIIMDWECTGTIFLFEPLLIAKPEKVEEYLGHAGRFIGLGRFRPINNGHYGRFEVTSFGPVKG